MAELNPISSSTRENRSYGWGLRGIQLFFSSPLVVSQEEFNSLRCPRCELGRDGWLTWEKWEREEDHLIPLVLGRDDLLLLAYLNLVCCSVGH